MLVTDSVDVPQAAGVKKARIYGNAARDVELRTQVRLSLYQQGRREANKCYALVRLGHDLCTSSACMMSTFA